MAPESVTSMTDLPSERHVVHLHGLVPSEDAVDGALVLSELDYHRAGAHFTAPMRKQWGGRDRERGRRDLRQFELQRAMFREVLDYNRFSAGGPP